ncbi:MAG TPA: hypothetical protein VFU74_22130 [Actinocrinis sp.]|nr:hypothetical protein [Actinocrinis sp.]
MVESDVKAKASRILRQLAAVEVERAQLARDLGAGGAGAFEDELAQVWRALASVVDGEGFDIARVAAGSAERDPWTEKPSALTFWGNLSDAQQSGTACLICGGGISERYPDQRSAVINGKQTFIHVDPEVCSRELERKIDKEIPF